ncbi:hypothetical protein EDD22DRAFT_999332 [Suillus occidentalis]|nr:hypothetical protein EDD22DRAFT_999332 [Suillus occidentalis]
MSSDPDSPMAPAAAPAVTPVSTGPTHHMNTDSRANKRTRPPSPTPDPNSVTEESSHANPSTTVTKTAKPTPNSNKRLNLDCSTQQPPPTNAWHYLQSGANTTAEVSANGIRTLDSGYKITATPAGGFPIPQLGQSTWRNVSLVLKEKWPQKEGAKAWVRTYCAKYETNAQGTVAKLKSAITMIIGKSDAEHLVVSTPTAEIELVEHLPPPWHFLISGIPPEALERLLRLRVCSSAEVSCFFVPFEQPLPTYAFTLENFSFPDSEATNREIAEIVKETIRSNPDVLQSVKETVWNIYFDSPPALTLKQYFDWTNLLRTLFYISEDYGYGTARQDTQFICMGCKSFDHPTVSENDTTNTTLDNRSMNGHGRGAFRGNMSRGGRGHSRGSTRGSGKRGRGMQY